VPPTWRLAIRAFSEAYLGVPITAVTDDAEHQAVPERDPADRSGEAWESTQVRGNPGCSSGFAEDELARIEVLYQAVGVLGDEAVEVGVVHRLG
jgi:hypothetical protein